MNYFFPYANKIHVFKTLPTASMIELQNRVLRGMGLVLVMNQITEKLLKNTVDIILPKGGVGDPEEFLRRLESVDKRTIGVFLNILRERVDIASSFDDMLRDFLAMRNDLTHDVERIPGFGLNSEPELMVASAYVKRLLDLNQSIQRALFGLGRAWQLQNDIVLPNFDANNDFVKEIDQNVAPSIDWIFFDKHK